jgi:anaerobic ribonucleoside-triphosphate reductase activating protein
LQEVPGEISLLFSITGCDIGCRGCHTPELWDQHNGTPLAKSNFDDYLSQYKGFVSCILFFGGEWQPQRLIELLKTAQAQGFKTCLYSGRDEIPADIAIHLNFLKLGDYRQSLGGLASPNTNQRFFDLMSNQIINSKFIKK